MSCLSNGVTHRQIVLFCARLLVQCVMAWSTSQIGMDDAKSFVPHHASDEAIARHDGTGESSCPFRKWKPYQMV